MEEVRKSLTEKEQALLSDLFENIDTRKALTKALSQHQLNLAMGGMAQDADWEQFLANKGTIIGLKWPYLFLKHNHKAWQKRREQSPANQETTEIE